MSTEFSKIESIVADLSEMDPKLRECLFKLDYSQLNGMKGEELKKRITKAFVCVPDATGTLMCSQT